MKLARRLLLPLSLTLMALLAFPGCSSAGRATPPGPPDVRPLPHCSPAYLAWALSWHRADVRWARVDGLLRHRLRLGSLRAVARPPGVLAYPSYWRSAAMLWRAQAKARCADYQTRWRALIAPRRPYTAASWWPLAHYLGWPSWARTVWLKVVRGESHGQPHAMANPSNPRSATGLMQICPGGRRFLNVVTNIRAGLSKFIAAHFRWSPWAATAY